MRAENTIKNVSVGLGGQMISCLMSFIVRTVFVHTLSAEYLGVSGLFTNILTVLSLAELGIGNAIVFSMYRPIAEGNEGQLKQILSFYGKVYRAVGLIIGTIGMLLAPFLELFVNEMPDIPMLRLIYILYLANTVASYFYSYKSVILEADQKQYISNFLKYKYMIVRDMVQIVILYLTHNFILYLVIQLLITVYGNWKTSKKAETIYSWLHDLKTAPKLEKEIQREIKKNVFATFNHNVGAVVVNGTDNILIAKFAGLAEVGLYSNYVLILNGIVAIVAKITQAASASVGNLGVLENEDKVYSIYRTINLVNFWVYSFCAICFWILFQPFIGMWLGADYLLPDFIVFVICCNFYVSGMRRVNITFRDAMGLFWYDRYKPLAEAAINLIASVILAKIWGILGILLGTFISNMLTGFWVEPYILYKYKFKHKLREYMRDYFVYTVCMVIIGAVIWKLSFYMFNVSWTTIIFRSILCVLFINLFYLAVFWKTQAFKDLWKVMGPEIKKIMNR